jgi:hypothetical protein
MMGVLPRVALAVLMLGACASSESAKKDSDAAVKASGAGATEAVSAHFGWKPGWTFKIRRQAVESTQKPDGTVEKEEIKMDFRARVTGYEKGALLLTYDKYTNLSVVDSKEKMLWSDLSDAEKAEVDQTYTRATPALVVEKDGRFRHALKAEGAIDFIRTLADEPSSPKTKARMDSLVTADVIQNAARNEWAIQAALWLQHKFVPGEYLRSELQGPHPMAPHVAVKNVMTFGVEKRLPCPKNEARSCAGFILIMESDPSSMEKVVGALVNELSPKNPDGTLKESFKINSIRNKITHTLIADIETLQPYVMRKTTEVEVDALEDGQPSKTTRVSQMTTAYYLQEEHASP